MRKKATLTEGVEFDRKEREGYNRVASEYDQKRFTSPIGRFYTRVEEELVREIIRPRCGMRILDVAGGTGRIAIPMAKEGASVAMIDISENMLQEATKKVRETGLKNIGFHLASARTMPFRENTFDVVMSFKFFHLIPNREKKYFVDEMVRVLKPGGLLIAQFNSPFYGILLPVLRYHLLRKTKGSVRTSCLWPDQARQLFRDLEVLQKTGVILPFAGAVARLMNPAVVSRVSRGLCKLFPLNYLLSYYMIIVARKPAHSDPEKRNPTFV